MLARPLIAVLPMLAAPWAAAATDAPAVSEEEIIVLRINGQEAGSPLLVRRDSGGTLLVRTEDFQSLRLKPPQEATVLVDGVAYFRLGASMGADIHFDEATQSADITLPAAAFLPTVAVLSDTTLHPATVSPGASSTTTCPCSTSPG
jgi:outer membrane usher protein FimD/PapC